METEDEDVVTRASTEYKLRCNIVGGGGSDTKVDHLYQGLELGLSGEGRCLVFFLFSFIFIFIK